MVQRAAVSNGRVGGYNWNKGTVCLGGCEHVEGGWEALVPVGKEEWVGGCWCRVGGGRVRMGPLKAPVLTEPLYLPLRLVTYR